MDLLGIPVLEMAGRQMRPKIILGDLIWSDIRVFVARRIMFG